MTEPDKKSGISKTIREKAVEIVVGILLLGSWYDHKGDISNLRTEMRTEIGTLRAEMGTLRTEVKTDIGSLRTEMGTLRTEVKTDIGSLRAEVSDIQKKITLIDPKTGKTISISEMFALVYNGVANLEANFTRLEATAAQIAKSAPEIFNVLVQIRDSLKEKKE